MSRPTSRDRRRLGIDIRHVRANPVHSLILTWTQHARRWFHPDLQTFLRIPSFQISVIIDGFALGVATAMAERA